MAKRAGESVRSFLITGAFFYAQFFGLFASFKLDRFVLGLMVPPVAWFDSIYYWFTPSEWQKHWDTKVEALSKVMFAQVGELGDKQLQVEGQLRDWIRLIPDARRAQLRSKFHMFVDAMMEHCVETALTNEEPKNSMDGFLDEPGLVRAWQQYKIGFDAVIKEQFAHSGPISAGREREVRQMVKKLVTALNAKVDTWL
jgi:hypothetical protein